MTKRGNEELRRLIDHLAQAQQQGSGQGDGSLAEARAPNGQPPAARLGR